MTPRVVKMASIAPDLSADFVWFDIGPIPNAVEYKGGSAITLMPLPFEATAIVGTTHDGRDFLVFAKRMNGERIGGVLTGWVMTAKSYGKLDTVSYYVDGGEVWAKTEGADKDFGHRIALAVAIAGRLLEILSVSPLESHTASKRANHAKRVRQGKPALFDWSTVVIEPSKPKTEHQGGTHASPRRHQRRGHMRRTPSGKMTWVRDTWVGDAAAGTVFHDYKVPA